MGPQHPSTSSAEASNAPVALANDGAEVPASTSGEPDPAPVVPVQQQQRQQEREVGFYCPATLKQCQQLFGATCRVQLHRCQIPDSPAEAENSVDVATPSSSEASAGYRDVSKVKDEEDTSFCEEVAPSGATDLRGARKLVEYSDSESDSNDEDIKVFPYSPAAAASSKKRPVSVPTASQVKWEDSSSDPEENEEEPTIFPASPAVRKKNIRRRVSQRKSSIRCHVCKRTLSSKGYLKAHMAKHTGERRYKCEKCGRSFLYRGSLLTHKKRTDQQNGVCPRVNKKYDGSWRPKGSWTCEICRKEMKSPKNYLVHMRAHRGDKAFNCGECGKAFVTSGDLSKHRRIHSQVWQFTCVFCEKGFHFCGDYWAHLRIHTQEKPYFCVVEGCGCGASFAQLGTLKYHRRNIHFKKY